MVSTVVVRSGTATRRTIALRMPIAVAINAVTAYAETWPAWMVYAPATSAARM